MPRPLAYIFITHLFNHSVKSYFNSFDFSREMDKRYREKRHYIRASAMAAQLHFSVRRTAAAALAAAPNDPLISCSLSLYISLSRNIPRRVLRISALARGIKKLIHRYLIHIYIYKRVCTKECDFLRSVTAALLCRNNLEMPARAFAWQTRIITK